MKSYRIAHITDLLQIPPEHWDEAMRDLRAAMVSLHLVRAAAACAPGAPPHEEPKDMCPYIDFIPDGKGEITPVTLDGKRLFTMTVTQDKDTPHV